MSRQNAIHGLSGLPSKYKMYSPSLCLLTATEIPLQVTGVTTLTGSVQSDLQVSSSLWLPSSHSSPNSIVPLPQLELGFRHLGCEEWEPKQICVAEHQPSAHATPIGNSQLL